MPTILQFVLAFLLSILTAYIDLTTFFQQKARFRISPLGHVPSVFFLALNGVVAGVLLYITAHNHWITENHWSLAIISGLGTAGLLRSKLFTFGQDKYEVGFEFIYNFFKNQVIAKLANASGIAKIHLSFKFAETFGAVNDVMRKMDNAANEMKKSPDWDSEKITRFDTELAKVKSDNSYIEQREKMAAMIRVFIDYSDINFVNKLLVEFLK